ncbi:hypothetical protein OG394_00535 [Kribbella sp. NBC_01245]|uniref:hypothetical protein n=1 Tax=Kribbella sp. NBC_01245 TaxID=2903578 RepID=UPI002E2B1EB8|nr:hypothetical protein [Kribbella sp. NBC_01245]
MRFIAAAAGLVLIAGCSSVDAADIRTSGFNTNIVVTVPERATHADVWVQLRSGTLTYVDLSDTDKLTSTAGGQTVDLRRHKSLGVITYLGRLDNPGGPGSEVVLGLQRDSENDPAPRSVVRLADPVGVLAPSAGARHSRARDLAVRLTTPSDQQTSIEWTGPCVSSGSLRLDPGQSDVTIPRGSFKVPPPATTSPTPSPLPSSCKLTLTVTRSVDGQLDPAYKKGTIRAESVATREFTSIP